MSAVNPGSANAGDAARPRVALLMLDIADLAGGGGTERFFADVAQRLAGWPARRFDPLLVCDESTAAALARVGRTLDGVPRRMLRGRGGGLGTLRAAWALARGGLLDDVALVHIPLVSPAYLPWLWACELPGGQQRPPVTFTMVDCGLAHLYFTPAAKTAPEQRKSYWLHRLYFDTVRTAGIYSWYEAFRDRFAGVRIRGRPLVRAARYCFVDTCRFRPADAKENLVVYAARLVEAKRPALFMEAVRYALDREPEALRGWRFAVYGRGHLEAGLRALRAELRLEDRVEFTWEPNMERVFARSRVFVSTQDFENFTSLSMLEAMACGNAIVARDVGQTRWFVEPGRNGLLAADDSPAAIGEAILGCVRETQRLAALAAASRAVTLERHCAENFLGDLEEFWTAVLQRAA